jgi:hypothetical protein
MTKLGFISSRTMSNMSTASLRRDSDERRRARKEKTEQYYSKMDQIVNESKVIE